MLLLFDAVVKLADVTKYHNQCEIGVTFCEVL